MAILIAGRYVQLRIKSDDKVTPEPLSTVHASSRLHMTADGQAIARLSVDSIGPPDLVALRTSGEASNFLSSCTGERYVRPTISYV